MLAGPGEPSAMPSFDITCGCDLQEVDNALNQARKELQNRFDFKGTKWELELDRKESAIHLHADDQVRLKSLVELVRERLVKRGVSLRNVETGPVQQASLGSVRVDLKLAQGVASDKAREIVAFLKAAKLKRVQASIQADAVRVSGPKRDDLQGAIQAIKGHDFGLDLEFGNFRE
jgi:hypothetical protein